MGVTHFGSVDWLAGSAESRGVPAPNVVGLLSGLALLAGGLSIALGAYPAVGAASSPGSPSPSRR